MEKIILEHSAKSFIELANGGNFAAAILKLRNEVSMQQGLYACDELSTQTINSLIQSCTPGIDDRNKLILEVCRDLIMPQRLVAGGAGLDLDEARRYILEKLANNANSRKPKQEYPSAAFANFFYPEYFGMNARERVVYLAENHKNLSAYYPRQVNLFSLGGFFNWNNAEKETNPGGTTCGKFVRACLFTAGCRAMNNWANTPKSTIFNYIGLGNQGDGHHAFVRFDQNKQPKRGDVFWVSNGTMMYKGQKADDSHVGIITKVMGSTWETVEGGQEGGTVTRKFTRTFNMYGSTPRFSANGRRIRGWVDIEKFSWAF